jgi:hypothetical protein
VTERDRDFREDWRPGPTGPAPTTESVGDPEADNPQSGAEEGAAMGGLVGTALAGPVGFAVGAVTGAVVGGAGEAVDADLETAYERATEGTGPVDPIYQGADAQGRDSDQPHATDEPDDPAL